MTEMTSEDRDELDDTIEDEMQVDAFARAAAREASAMLLDLLIAHHGRRASAKRNGSDQQMFGAKQQAAHGGHATKNSAPDQHRDWRDWEGLVEVITRKKWIFHCLPI